MYTIAFAVIGLAVGSLLHQALAVVLTVAGGVIGWRMDVARADRKRREAAQSATESTENATLEAIVLPAATASSRKAGKRLPSYKGMYLDLEIVGESYRQDAIQRLWRGPDFTHTAMMVPESKNPHDPNAVRVEVEGVQVGYLSRATAKAYRDRMGDGACQVPVHFVQGGTEGTIGVFAGRSQLDRERVHAAIERKTKK